MLTGSTYGTQKIYKDAMTVRPSYYDWRDICFDPMDDYECRPVPSLMNYEMDVVQKALDEAAYLFRIPPNDRNINFVIVPADQVIIIKKSAEQLKLEDDEHLADIRNRIKKSLGKSL
jgi:hypothetical protein